ncbi:MAG: class I SAM-dependent methyltransferase [Gemmatimonadota bacterium]|jgi:SAM-dependent methyltransferase
MTRRFPDHFSGHAALYQRYRPTYPAALYAWLAERSPSRRVAWDCATGNGQAAVGLAPHFDAVVATDASGEQLAHARPHARVSYVRATAEQAPLPPASVDMVTVAQAVHWFDMEAFYREVRRVARPGGHLAVWTYSLVEAGPEVDGVVRWFYDDVVGPYWPPERQHVHEHYEKLPFPFDEVDGVPHFDMRPRWTREDLLGQLTTWSSVNRYRDAHGEDPLALLEPRLAEVWPDPREVRTLSWPIILRVGRL